MNEVAAKNISFSIPMEMANLTPEMLYSTSIPKREMCR